MFVSLNKILFLVVFSSTCVICSDQFKRSSEPVEEWDTLEGEMEPGIQRVLQLFDEVKEGDESVKWADVTEVYDEDLCPRMKRFVQFQRVVPHLQSDPYVVPAFCNSYTSDFLQKTVRENSHMMEPPADMSAKLAICSLFTALVSNFGPEMELPDVEGVEQAIRDNV